MRNEEFTGPELPAKVKKDALQGEVEKVAPGARVVVRDAITWSRFDDKGVASYDTDPPKLLVLNVPPYVTRQQLLDVLAKHRPQESDEDIRAKVKSPEQQLQKRLKDLEDRVAALEAKGK